MILWQSYEYLMQWCQFKITHANQLILPDSSRGLDNNSTDIYIKTEFYKIKVYRILLE